MPQDTFCKRLVEASAKTFALGLGSVGFFTTIGNTVDYLTRYDYLNDQAGLSHHNQTNCYYEFAKDIRSDFVWTLASFATGALIGTFFIIDVIRKQHLSTQEERQRLYVEPATNFAL